MAKIGEFEAAARYDGIGVGPQYQFSFETQAGIPIDGGNKQLRDMSPFQLRLVPPDALVSAAAKLERGDDALDLHSSAGTGTGAEAATIREDQAKAVDLINAAALGADQNTLASELSTALSRVSTIGTDAATLESFIASGAFSASQGGNHAVTLADAFMAAAIGLQLQRILSAPTLTLLVNPNSMAINYGNIQSHASKTRYGFIFERWGEEQPTISFSGTTGAFIAGASDAPGTLSTLAQVSGETETPSGVQWASKRDSAAFQNLMSLIHFYKSNGYIYDTVGVSEAHLFIGAVAIDYDQCTYVGHIESFSWGYSADKPHNIDWTMDFTVDRMFDNAQLTVAVLPQAGPTESPQGFLNTGGGTPGGTIGDALAGLGSSFDQATDPNSEFGVIPFELLVP
jgi:hypothetical protein